MNSTAILQTDPTGLPDAPSYFRTHEFPAAELHALLDLMVAGVFDVESDLLRLPTRGRARVALARQVAMYLAHVACGLSLTEVGELFCRDRTTVAHACTVIERRRDEASFDGAIDLLESIVQVLIGPSREVLCPEDCPPPSKRRCREELKASRAGGKAD